MPSPLDPIALDLGGRMTAHPQQIEPRTPPEPLQSQDILRGSKTVGILHNGALYRLQATRLGKLILTK